MNSPEVISQEEVLNEGVQYPMKAHELSLAIKDDESYKAAGEFLLTIKGFRKKVEETFGPVVKKANEAWKAALELRKQADGPLDDAERIIKPALAAYDQEQRRKAKEEEDRLIAEQKKRDDDARLAQAEETAKNGNLEAAEAILAAPPAPVFVPPAAPRAKLAGISYAEAWKAECVDLKALVAAVAAGKSPLTLLQANTVAINSMAKALKGEFRAEGIRVWSENVVSGRAK